MSVDLIMNDIDADFTRPVSDLYWLNQIKKSKKYQEFFDMFNNLEMSNFSELTNQLNKENMQRLLDNSIFSKTNVELDYSQLIKNIAFALKIPSIDLEFSNKKINILRNFE